MGCNDHSYEMHNYASYPSKASIGASTKGSLNSNSDKLFITCLGEEKGSDFTEHCSAKNGIK